MPKIYATVIKDASITVYKSVIMNEMDLLLKLYLCSFSYFRLLRESSCDVKPLKSSDIESCYYTLYMFFFSFIVFSNKVSVFFFWNFKILPWKCPEILLSKCCEQHLILVQIVCFRFKGI